MLVERSSGVVDTPLVQNLCQDPGVGHPPRRLADVPSFLAWNVEVPVPKAHGALHGEDPWKLLQVLKLLVLPARGTVRMFMKKVPPFIDLLLVEVEARVEVPQPSLPLRFHHGWIPLSLAQVQQLTERVAWRTPRQENWLLEVNQLLQLLYVCILL